MTMRRSLIILLLLLSPLLSNTVHSYYYFYLPNTLKAAGDASRGKQVFKRCESCHSVKIGKNKAGPSLAGMVGRAAGTVPKYRYSKAGLKNANWKWDEVSLDGWLENPKKWLKTINGGRSKMSYKLRKAEHRADVIAYLKTK